MAAPLDPAAAGAPGPVAEVRQWDRRLLLACLILFAILFAAAIAWAKWIPYWHKGFTVADSHTLGDSIVTGGADRAPAFSWSASTDFAGTYLISIWPALLAALVIASALQTLVPRRRVMDLLDDRGHGPVKGALLALPSLMCTCCTAPVAVSLRRSGAGPASALSYWVGNPALNPAVLIFMAFVLSWQWVLLRGLFGVLMVIVVARIALRMTGSREKGAGSAVAGAGGGTGPGAAPRRSGPSGIELPARRLPLEFGRNLLRFSITLIPEYVVIVLLLGALRGPLFPLGDTALLSGVAGVAIFAVVGTLFVIPTAAEVPIVGGLLALGIGSGPAGALLVTLPAMSLPSLIMVGRSFPLRVLIAVASGCALVGVLCGASAAALL